MASEYVTESELEARMSTPRLVDCTDDDKDGVPDPAIVTVVIQDASSIMDGFFMNAGYPVPLEGGLVTPAVKHHTGFLAAHYAAKRRPQYRNAQGEAPYWKERDEAFAWGKLVADGKIKLSVEPAPLATAPQVRQAYQGQRPPRRLPKNMRGW